MAGWVLSPSPWLLSSATETIFIPGVQPAAPKQASNRKTSLMAPLVSPPGTGRFVAADSKARKRPAALRAGPRLLPSAFTPPVGEPVTPGAVSVTVANFLIFVQIGR